MAKKNSFSYSRNRKKLGRKGKTKLKIRKIEVDRCMTVFVGEEKCNRPIVKSAWKHGVSVRSNFDHLGIAYDPNKLLGIRNKNFSIRKSSQQPQLCKKSSVVEALEEAAKCRKQKPVFVSEDDQLFCTYNLEMYNEDFEAMSRDSRNVYQLTAKQIEKLINKFKQTKAYLKYINDKQTGSLDIHDIFDISTDV